MEDKDYNTAHKKLNKKKKLRASDFKGKNVVYMWLRMEGKMSIGQISKMLEMYYAKVHMSFKRPEKYITEWHVERIAYSLPNRTIKEIKIALAEKDTLIERWYEENTND